MNVIDQLKVFIKEGQESSFVFPKWLEDENFRVYVRKGKHLINGKMTVTLDIGNVTVVENKRHQGIFKNFLAQAAEINPWGSIYVENVLDPFLPAFFIRNGWLPVNHEFPYSFVSNI